MNYLPTIIAKRLRRAAYAGITAAVLLGTAPSSAQTIADMFDAKTQKALGVLGGAMMKAPPAAASAAQGADNPSSGALMQGAEMASYLFRYDPAVSTEVRDRVIQLATDMVKEQGKLDEASEKEVVQELKKLDIVQTIGDALQAKGYPRYSLATAVAYWMVINLEMVYGKQFSDQQNTAVLRQMEQQMANNPEVASMSDESKQYTSEGLTWIATMQYIGWQNAEGAAQKKAIVDAARSSLKQMNIDPDRLELTDQGLRVK